MSYTKKDIIDALKVIRSVCKITEGGTCDRCELFNEDYGACQFECVKPADWCISSEDRPWRAFV